MPYSPKKIMQKLFSCINHFLQCKQKKIAWLPRNLLTSKNCCLTKCIFSKYIKVNLVETKKFNKNIKNETKRSNIESFIYM